MEGFRVSIIQTSHNRTISLISFPSYRTISMIRLSTSRHRSETRMALTNPTRSTTVRYIPSPPPSYTSFQSTAFSNCELYNWWTYLVLCWAPPPHSNQWLHRPKSLGTRGREDDGETCDWGLRRSSQQERALKNRSHNTPLKNETWPPKWGPSIILLASSMIM